MTPLHTRLRAAEDHLRGVSNYALTPEMRAEALAHAEAVAEAAKNAELDDDRLFLPLDFVRQQQAEMEARIKALESERDLWRVSSVCREKEAELVALRGDKARLDYLDSLTTILNAQHGTTYGWKVDWNHNRTSLSVTDCNLPALGIRAAIDAAMNK